MKDKVTDMYKEALALGLEIDNWCSDLYLYVNNQSVELVERYEFKQNVTTFISETDGKSMFEIPFAFTPYYEKVS